MILSLCSSGEAQYEEAIFRMVTALAQKLSECSEWQEEVQKFSRILWMDFEEGRRPCSAGYFITMKIRSGSANIKFKT